MIEEVVEDIELKKDNTRFIRRKKNASKARRKRQISRQVYGIDWYNNLHQYSKNKVHCSCPMCRFRSVFEPDAKPVQDIKTEDKMKYREEEYRNT